MNPFAVRLDRARAKLARLYQAQQRVGANAPPSTFVTGRSGVPASRQRRLSRALERTIDLAKQIVETQRQVDDLSRKVRLFETGQINKSGRVVRSKHPTMAKTKRHVMRLEIDRLLEQIDIYGHVTVNDWLVRSIIKPLWDQPKAAPQVWVVVTSPSGDVVEYRTRSIQGVDFYAVESDVFRTILTKGGDNDERSNTFESDSGCSSG